MVEAVGHDNLQAYMQAIGRLLKPGGTAVIQVWQPKSFAMALHDISIYHGLAIHEYEIAAVSLAQRTHIMGIVWGKVLIDLQAWCGITDCCLLWC